MKQCTLISLYGEKKKEIASLIAESQKLVAKIVGPAFKPYDLLQIHATIIGLEGRTGFPAYNANFAKHRGRDVLMDFDGFLTYLRGGGHFPLQVQIGGFANRDYPFRSRNALPFERSFSIQGDRVVLMGWPLQAAPATPEACVQEARIHPCTLDILRHAAQRFGVLHDYHPSLTDVDNDLFFRIGLIDDPKSLASGTRQNAESQLRQVLSAQQPLVMEIRLEDICIAAYEDNRLPLPSTQAWSLADPRVTGAFISRLFT
jgi:hypothetical protein